MSVLKNIELQKREILKEFLSCFSESQKNIFKRMYSHQDLEKDINLVVDDMPAEKLDNAIRQCERTTTV